MASASSGRKRVSSRPVGRPRRFAKFEEFEASLPKVTGKRPVYCDGIGIYRGAKSATVWVKIRMPKGGAFRGRSVPAGASVEYKLGKRSSWDWASLVQERDRLQGLADRGEPLEAAEIPTFEKYAQEWLDRRKPSLRNYGVTKGNIHAALMPAFGKMALNAISVGDVNRWIGQQLRDLKPSSVQRQLNTFNAIMNDAVRNGIIERNPSDLADKIKGIEPRLRFITDDEWKTILQTAKAIEAEQEAEKESKPHQIRGWLTLFLKWAYNSGMRRAEIIALTWDNVRQVGEHTVVEVVNTKTGKPRFVTCTQEMKDVLNALEAIEREEGDRRLFPVSMTTLKRSLSKLWKATGLNDVRLHDLRRTHATLLVKANVDPRTVAGRLGHSGTAMLAKHYAIDLGDIEAARVFGERAETGD